MKIQRMPLVLLGAIVAVAIAAVGSYYGFFAHNDGVQKHGLPSFAVGAETVIQVHFFRDNQMTTQINSIGRMLSSKASSTNCSLRNGPLPTPGPRKKSRRKL